TTLDLFPILSRTYTTTTAFSSFPSLPPPPPRPPLFPYTTLFRSPAADGDVHKAYSKGLGTLAFPVDFFAVFAAEKSTGNASVPRDRKSTRLNSSHVAISYAVFCLKKKKIKTEIKMWI